jgi:hypothetical protein
MSQLGHSRPSHSAPVPINVRYAPNIPIFAAQRNDAMCQSRHFALQKTASLFADHDKQTLSPRCMTVAKSNRLRHIENGPVEPYSLSLAIVESRGSIGEGGR